MTESSTNVWAQSDFSRLGRDELIARLRIAEAATVESIETGENEAKAFLTHELEVHQIELEMQNRQLKESHHLLEASQSRYADLYENCPAGLVIIDSTGHIDQVNVTAANMFSTEKAMMVGHSLVYYVARQERMAFVNEIRRCLNEHQSSGFNSTVTFTGRGGVKKVQVCMRRTRSIQTEQMCVFVSLVDVSKQVALNEEVAFIGAVGVELSNTLKQSAVTSAILKMAVPKLADLSFITYVGAESENSTAQETISLHCDEAVWSSKRSREIISALRGLRLVERCQARRGRVEWLANDADFGTQDKTLDVLRATNVARIEAWPLGRRDAVFAVLLLVWSGDKPQQILASASVLHNFVHRAALSLDNARLYRLAQAQIKARSEFLAIVAHDLRNPLSVVSMQAERLRTAKKWADEPRIKKYAETIAHCATRMDTLVRDLLDAASMDGRQLSVTPVATNVKSLLDGESLELSSIADRKNVVLKEEIAGDLQVFCDPRRSSQVLENLVSNAVKFTQPGGTVTLKAISKGDTVQFSVQDTGCGMNESTREKVFEPFWQAKSTTQGGVGLGLSICKNIIEVSGGRLWVESKEGQGSTFFFTLPTTSPIAHPPPNLLAVTRLGHLLLVDDDDTFRESLSELLTEQGYTVSAASNGAMALKALQGGLKPVLILLDLQMPVMDGFAFLERRSSEAFLAAIPILVLSAAVHEKSVLASCKTQVMYKLTPVQDVLHKIALMREVHSDSQVVTSINSASRREH